MLVASPLAMQCARPGAQATFPHARAAVGYAAWSESAATDEIGAAVQSNQMTTKPSEKGAATMKLTTMTQVTVDGVMQGNGGASDEDRRNGFERGGWAMGVCDNETMTFINETYQRADAFLFGRRTYELFAGYWGAEERARAAAEDSGNHQVADALNTKPKYLVSTTLTEPRWADTTVLSGDVAEAIGELKAKPGVSCRCTAAAPDPVAAR
jgi:dihydrofolate reductase